MYSILRSMYEMDYDLRIAPMRGKHLLNGSNRAGQNEEKLPANLVYIRK